MKTFSPGTGRKSLCSTGTGLNGIIDVVSAVCMWIYMYLYTYVCMCKATFKHPYGSVPSKVYRWTWSAAHLTAGLQHCLVRTYVPSCFAWEMNSCRKQTVLKAKEIEEIFFFPPHNAAVRWVQVWNMFSGVYSTVFLNSLNSVLAT